MVSGRRQWTIPPLGQDQNRNHKMTVGTMDERGTERAKQMPRAQHWKELNNKAKIQAT
jgi:hypothetical protein